jgi:hypothetical protein
LDDVYFDEDEDEVFEDEFLPSEAEVAAGATIDYFANVRCSKMIETSLVKIVNN